MEAYNEKLNNWIENVDNQVTERIMELISDPTHWQIDAEPLRRSLEQPSMLERLRRGEVYHKEELKMCYGRDDNKAFLIVAAYRIAPHFSHPFSAYKHVVHQAVNLVAMVDALACEPDCYYHEDPWLESHTLCPINMDIVMHKIVEIWLRRKGEYLASGSDLAGNHFWGDWRGDPAVQGRMEQKDDQLLSTCEVEELIRQLDIKDQTPKISKKAKREIKKASKISLAKAARKQDRYVAFQLKKRLVSRDRKQARQEKLMSTGLFTTIKKTVKVTGVHLSAFFRSLQILAEPNNEDMNLKVHCVSSQLLVCLDSLVSDFSLRNILRQVATMLNVCGYPLTYAVMDLWNLIKPHISKIHSALVESWCKGQPVPSDPSQQPREEEHLTSTADFSEEISNKLSNGDLVSSVSAIMAGAAVLFASLVLGKESVSKMPDATLWVDKLAKAGKTIAHGKTGLYAIITMIQDFSTWIKKIVESYFMGRGVGALAFALMNSDVNDSDTLKKENILDYIVELTDPGNRDYLLTKNEYRDKLDFCLVVCQDVQRKICEGKIQLDRVAIEKHSQLIVELKKLKHFACKRAPEGFFRITPFWFYLYGPPGTGKSVIMSKIADTILEALYPQAAEFQIPSKDRWKIAVNFADKYMSNYAQEYCVMVDDVFQDAPGTLETPSALNLINWISCIPHQTVQAALEDKGMYFQSKLVITSSNSSPQVTRPEIIDPEALRRRISMSAQLLPVDKNENWFDPDIKKGTKLVVNNQNIYFKEMVAQLTIEFVKHYRAQQQLLESRTASPDHVQYIRELLQSTSDEIQTRRELTEEDYRARGWSYQPDQWHTTLTRWITWPNRLLSNIPAKVIDTAAGKMEWNKNLALEDSVAGFHYLVMYLIDHGWLEVFNRRVKFYDVNGEDVEKVLPFIRRTKKEYTEEFLQQFIPTPEDGALVQAASIMDMEDLHCKILATIELFNQSQRYCAMSILEGLGDLPEPMGSGVTSMYFWFRPEMYSARLGQGSTWKQIANVMKASQSSVWEFLTRNWIFKAWFLVSSAKTIYDLVQRFRTPTQPIDVIQTVAPSAGDLASTAIKYEFSKPARARVPKIIKLTQTADVSQPPVQIEGFYDDTPDQGAYAVANSMVSHGQVCTLVCRHKDIEGKEEITNTARSTCIRIAGTAILACNHAFRGMVDGDEFEVIMPNYKVGERVIKQVYSSNRKVQIGQKDLAVYKCDMHMPPARNIVGHFPDSSIKNGYTNAVLLQAIPTLSQVVNLKAEPISPARVYTGLDNKEYDLSCVFRCKYETQQGQSGSPLLAVNNRVNRKILGLATCKGMLGYSYYTVVSQGELYEAFEKLKVDTNLYQDIDLLSTSLQVDDVRPCPPMLSMHSLEFIGDIPQKLSMKPPTSTKLMPSLIHDPKTSKMGPSVLVPTDTRMKEEFRGQSVLLRNIAGYDRKYGSVDPDLLDQVIDEMGNEYKNMLTKPNIMRRELTNHEIINGIPAVLKRIEMDSSPGYPFVKERVKTQQAGKYEWFESYTGQDEQKIYTMRSDLQDCFERQDQIIRQGMIPSEWVGYVCLKDEKRSYAKIENGATRTFICLPMTYNFAIRKYFGTFIATQHQLAGTIASCVGIDPARGWTDLYYRLLKKSEKWEDFDYKQWDQSLHPAFFEAYAEIVSKWYGDAPGTPGYNARKALMYFLCHTPLIIGDRFFVKGGGQCSGCAITAEINCVIHDMLMFYTWLKLMKESGNKDLMTLDVYRDKVALAVYGDDIVISISEECREVFSGQHIKRVTDELGMKITAADKTENFRVKAPYEVTFLKRSFIADPEKPPRILCPIDKTVIEEIPQWIHKSDDPLEATVTNCEMALREAYWHGKDYFTQLREQLNQRLARVQDDITVKRTVNLSYDYLKNLHDNDKLDVIAFTSVDV